MTSPGDLIGRIYDAAIGDDDWGEVLAGLSGAFDASGAGFLRPGMKLTQTGCDPAYLQRFEAHYHKVMPQRPIPAGSVTIDQTYAAPEARRTEFYNDFLLPQDQHHLIAWHGSDAKTSPLLARRLIFMRSRRQAEWQEPEARLFRHLAPHLGRALEIERRIGPALAPREVRRLMCDTAPLAPRELQCLALIARGASSKVIARRLGLSVLTIEEYVKSAVRKLRAGSRSEAVAKALALGVLAI